jgi:hypothetical protein
VAIGIIILVAPHRYHTATNRRSLRERVLGDWALFLSDERFESNQGLPVPGCRPDARCCHWWSER